MLGPHISWAEFKQRAAAVGVKLPGPLDPKGDYRSAIVHNGAVYTSGVGPMLDGRRLHCGYVGDDVTLEQAQQAAVVATMNALTSAHVAAGGIEAIETLIKLTAFVRSARGFIQQNAVIDPASRVLYALMGERGTHARSAVGVAELPFGICVEIELIAAIRPADSLDTPRLHASADSMDPITGDSKQRPGDLMLNLPSPPASGAR